MTFYDFQGWLTILVIINCMDAGVCVLFFMPKWQYQSLTYAHLV